MSYDMITLGETMLRLTPPDYKRLEQAVSFNIEVGGSESNTAIGLARLGWRVAWLSRLTANPLGQLIASTIKGYGVDTSPVIWTEQDRVGLYFLETGKAPRGSRVVYDRANSAISRIKPGDLPADLFLAGNAKLLHLSGITPALSESAAATARQAVELAKANGWKISFDFNYRSKLWSPTQAKEGCTYFAANADIILLTQGDSRLLFNFAKETTSESILESLSRVYPHATVVLTLGKEGAIGIEREQAILFQPAYPAEEVDRLGGGDAFTAGLLHGYLQNEGKTGWLAHGLKYGAAVAAFKYSIGGDIPLIEREEVEALVAQTITPKTGIVR
jgi:2-dehydro-3-deoxygluconokinase